MASTNKTTNYELSQYIGTDKPTYLTDYNQDMSKIDAGIHAAKSEADTNSTAIGTLSSLTTTAKNNLVAAINEIDSDVATNTSNISDNTSNIATNTAAIGTLSNLTTTNKTSLVNASNEINAKVGTLSNLSTETKTSVVAAINETRNSFDVEVKKQYLNTNEVTPVNATITGVNVKIAKSTNGDIGKIYGNITFQAGYSTASFTLANSGIRTNASYGIDNIVMLSDSAGTVRAIKPLTVNDNELYIIFGNLINGSAYTVSIIPVMLYFKDFGDTPQN